MYAFGRFVGGLSGLHTFFTSTNRTTYEHFRARVNGQGNPYDVGCFRNWVQVVPINAIALSHCLIFNFCTACAVKKGLIPGMMTSTWDSSHYLHYFCVC